MSVSILRAGKRLFSATHLGRDASSSSLIDTCGPFLLRAEGAATSVNSKCQVQISFHTYKQRFRSMALHQHDISSVFFLSCHEWTAPLRRCPIATAAKLVSLEDSFSREYPSLSLLSASLPYHFFRVRVTSEKTKLAHTLRGQPGNSLLGGGAGRL